MRSILVVLIHLFKTSTIEEKKVELKKKIEVKVHPNTLDEFTFDQLVSAD